MTLYSLMGNYVLMEKVFTSKVMNKQTPPQQRRRLCLYFGFKTDALEMFHYNVDIYEKLVPQLLLTFEPLA